MRQQQQTPPKREARCIKLGCRLRQPELVGVGGFKLNRELAKFLLEHPAYHEQIVASTANSYHAPKWHVRDRLSEKDVAELITAFKAGTAKHILAKCYGINEKSVKQLLREHGVRKRHRYDVQQ